MGLFSKKYIIMVNDMDNSGKNLLYVYKIDYRGRQNDFYDTLDPSEALTFNDRDEAESVAVSLESVLSEEGLDWHIIEKSSARRGYRY